MGVAEHIQWWQVCRAALLCAAQFCLRHLRRTERPQLPQAARPSLSSLSMRNSWSKQL